MVVVPIVVAILIGLAAGALRRGRMSSLIRVRLRRPVLLAIAVGCALVSDLVTLPAPTVWALIGLVAGIAFVGSNLLVPGMAVIGLGVIANLVPIALNGAMPVRGDALVEADIVAAEDLDRVELDGPRELADDGTTLEILGDVIPIPLFAQVVSFGDLIILAGLADVIANLMRARRPRRLPEGADGMLAAMDWSIAPPDDIFVDLRDHLGDEIEVVVPRSSVDDVPPPRPSQPRPRPNPSGAPGPSPRSSPSGAPGSIRRTHTPSRPEPTPVSETSEPPSWGRMSAAGVPEAW